MSRQSRRYRFVVGCFIQFCKSDHGAIPVEGPAQIGNVQGSRRCAALNAHQNAKNSPQANPVRHALQSGP